MKQGKLEVVKQEMARVSVDILEISKLKWTGIKCWICVEGSGLHLELEAGS